MFLVIFSVLLAVILGFIKPYKTAWLVVLLVPLLGPGSLYMGVDTIMPITAYRLGFFALIGILIKLRLKIFSLVIKSKFTHIIIIYFFVIFLLQVKDYPIPTVFTMLPFYTLAVFLPFILIRSENDLYKLVNVFVLQATIISFFILVEYFTTFSLPAFIRQSSGIDISGLQTKGGVEIFRSGFYRVAGLHGNPVQTAYHLIFLFPFTLFYWQYQNSLVRVVPLFLILISFILLQTRASIITLLVVIVFILFLASFNKKINKTAIKLIRVIVFTSIGLLITSFFYKGVYEIAEKILSDLFITLFGSRGFLSVTDIDITVKIDRIPTALKLIFKSPIYGYLVSPRYAYFELMRCDDLPSIFLHLIGGGVLLGTLFIVMIFKIVYGTYREIQNRLPPKIKDLILYSTAAAFGGFFVTFSNMAEEHYLSIFMMFIAIKIYMKLIPLKFNSADNYKRNQ